MSKKENSFFSKLLIKYPKNKFNKLILSLFSLLLLFLSFLSFSIYFIERSYKLFKSNNLYFNSLTSFEFNKSRFIYPKKFVIYFLVSSYEVNLDEIIDNNFFLNSRCISRQNKNKLQ